MGSSGKSGGTSGGPDVGEFLKTLNERQDQLFNIVKPSLEGASKGVEDILNTGGSDSQIPAIQAALASSRSAGSTSLRQLEEQSDRAGITGPDRTRLSTDLIRQSDQQAASIPFQFSAPILSQIYQSFIPTASGQSAQLLGQGTGVSGDIRKQELADQAAVTGAIIKGIADVTAAGVSKANFS